MHTQTISLSAEDWLKVIKDLQKKEKSKIYLFILRSLANSQQISYYSIHAFNEELSFMVDHEGQQSNPYIAQVTRSINSVIQDNISDETTWYFWHTTDKAWVISWSNLESLRKAFKEL